MSQSVDHLPSRDFLTSPSTRWTYDFYESPDTPDNESLILRLRPLESNRSVPKRIWPSGLSADAAFVVSLLLLASGTESSTLVKPNYENHIQANFAASLDEMQSSSVRSDIESDYAVRRLFGQRYKVTGR